MGHSAPAPASLCTWFGEVCSCCCLSLLPQLAYNILPTMYKDFFSLLCKPYFYALDCCFPLKISSGPQYFIANLTQTLELPTFRRVTRTQRPTGGSTLRRRSSRPTGTTTARRRSTSSRPQPRRPPPRQTAAAGPITGESLPHPLIPTGKFLPN